MPVAKDSWKTSPNLYVGQATNLRVLADGEENLLCEKSWDDGERDEESAQDETTPVEVHTTQLEVTVAESLRGQCLLCSIEANHQGENHDSMADIGESHHSEHGRVIHVPGKDCVDYDTDEAQ